MRASFGNSLGLLLDYYDFPYDLNSLNFFHFFNLCTLQIKHVEYMEMISSMKSNLRVSLADEVPAWVSVKRNRTSVDQTVRWLDECIKPTLVSVVYLYFLWH